MNRYFACLRKHNIKGVHLGTTSLNRSAVPFYEKLGFELYSRVEIILLKVRRLFR